MLKAFAMDHEDRTAGLLHCPFLALDRNSIVKQRCYIESLEKVLTRSVVGSRLCVTRVLAVSLQSLSVLLQWRRVFLRPLLGSGGGAGQCSTRREVDIAQSVEALIFEEFARDATLLFW